MLVDVPLELSEHEIHVWCAFEDRIREPNLIAAYRRMITPEERAAVDRFVFERHRHQKLVTLAMMRTIPSLYTLVPPSMWTYRRNQYGKPEITGPAGARKVRFNLSNTRGLVACAVTAHWLIGVDVEDLDRMGETLSIADSFFSAFEVRALRALPEHNQRDRFFAYWTLKESYIKARGRGLAIPLNQFSFHLGEGDEITISFGPKIEDSAPVWHFELHRLSEHHMLALAAKTGGSVRPTVRIHPFEPLVSAQTPRG